MLLNTCLNSLALVLYIPWICVSLCAGNNLGQHVFPWVLRTQIKLGSQLA